VNDTFPKAKKPRLNEFSSAFFAKTAALKLPEMDELSWAWESMHNKGNLKEIQTTFKIPF
jgi:hypothetical protein